MAGEFTLVEWSKIEADTRRKGVIDTLLMEAIVMQLIPWETIGQLATTITRLGTLPSVGFRKVNEGFAVGTGAMEQKVEHIALMGGFFDTDKAIARAKGIQSARAITAYMMTKSIAYTFNDKFVNGNPETDPEEFKGVYERVDDLNSDGYTGQYIDNAGTAGDGILLSSAESLNFLNKLDQLLYSIKGHNPDVLLMNDTLLLAIKALMRKEKLLDTTKDFFDRVIDTYGGARLLDIGCTRDQTTEIMPNTETLEDAGVAESTSIIAVKFGIGNLFWGIQEYPLEVTDKGLLEDKPIYRDEMDWPVGLANADPYCLARLYAIIPNATT